MIERTYKVLGEVQKGTDYRGKANFFVPVEINFEDGRTIQYNHKADRKKDVIADLETNKLDKHIQAAILDEQNRLSFQYTISFGDRGLQASNQQITVRRVQ